MNTAPRATCVCPTFNRPPAHQWLVEEAVESFLRQDYPHRELIVLNDCPGQVLRLDHPKVVVINVGRRFRTLGEKINAAVGLSQGELIAPWDDDDTSLPWRLCRSIEILGQADHYNPSRYWFIDRKGLHGEHAMGLAHGCSMFTRRGFDLVGGYPHTSGTQDLEIEKRLVAVPLARYLEVVGVAVSTQEVHEVVSGVHFLAVACRRRTFSGQSALPCASAGPGTIGRSMPNRVRYQSSSCARRARTDSRRVHTSLSSNRTSAAGKAG